MSQKFAAKVLTFYEMGNTRFTEYLQSIKEITDCKKLVGYRNVYRIRIGDYRAFFTFHVEIVNDTVFFRYLVSRGEAYDKKMDESLKRIDK